MTAAARVVGLWRYPVKSMGGERCREVAVGAGGVAGDRRYALVDAQTGKVASAKNPRLWPRLLDFGARYLESPANGHAGVVEITTPAGVRRLSSDAAVDAALSDELGRAVRLSTDAPATPVLEEYWPDLDDLAHRDEVTNEQMPARTFFDCASVHVLTTNTLEALARHHPAGGFAVGRFRPNVLVTVDGDHPFPEDDWIGKEITIGAAVVLRVTGPAPRCVMTTLGHGGLDPDLDVLRTAARVHGAHVGIYAEVVHGGTIAPGVALEAGS